MYLKLTQHCKLTMPQLGKKKKNNPKSSHNIWERRRGKSLIQDPCTFPLTAQDHRGEGWRLSKEPPAMLWPQRVLHSIWSSWARDLISATAEANVVLKPLREARDQTHNLMDTSWAHYCWTTMGTCVVPIFNFSCSNTCYRLNVCVPHPNS